MSHTRDETRSSRKRVELLNTMDTLSSHLRTTFAALSDSLTPQEHKIATSSGPIVSVQPLNRVHLMIVVGSSPGASKANVVMTVDGLEVSPAKAEVNEEAQQCATAVEESTLHGEDASDANAKDVGSNEADPEVDAPSSSSTSPSPSPPSKLPSQQIPSAQRESAPLVNPAPIPFKPLRTSTIQRSIPRSMPMPDQSFAQHQQELRAAERLLSRTLANANAEGAGLSAELGALHGYSESCLLLLIALQLRHKPMSFSGPQEGSIIRHGIRDRTTRVLSRIRSRRS